VGGLGEAEELQWERDRAVQSSHLLRFLLSVSTNKGPCLP